MAIRPPFRARPASGKDAFYERVTGFLDGADYQWHCRELDPEMSDEELDDAVDPVADRIAAVLLEVRRGLRRPGATAGQKT